MIFSFHIISRMQISFFNTYLLLFYFIFNMLASFVLQTFGLFISAPTSFALYDGNAPIDPINNPVQPIDPIKIDPIHIPGPVFTRLPSVMKINYVTANQSIPYVDAGNLTLTTTTSMSNRWYQRSSGTFQINLNKDFLTKYSTDLSPE